MLPFWYYIPILINILIWPFFLGVEYRSSNTGMFWLKTLCSLCFVSLAVMGCVIKGHIQSPYDGLLLIALVFCLLGDIVLVWQNRGHFFLIGLGLFFTAHLLFCSAFISTIGFSPLNVVLFFFLLLIPIAIYFWLKWDLGKLKIPALLYLLVVSFMLTSALSFLYLGTLPDEIRRLLAAGGLLFFASDGFLAMYKFHHPRRKIWRAVNLVTYYSGQILLASSLLFL